ncbi:retrotransposon protein, putative, ty1-copia subclass [Tanacetum coccineum]
MDTLLYGVEALTLEDVMATLNSKENKERPKAKGDDGEGLYVRGRTDHKDSCQSRGNPRLNSRGGRLKCYICQSEDHLKRNCLKNNRKKSTGYVKKDDQPSSSGSTYDDSKGSVFLGDNRECKIRGIGKVRVQLRDGLSFVLHNVRYIPELKINLISLGTLKKEGFTIKLQSGKVKVINGSGVVLSGTQRDNCVYSLDGYAVTGELNTSVEEKDSLAQVLHKRLGHISEAGLQVLEKKGLFGKKKSRFKHEAFEKFKEWKQLVDNQTGRTVKKLRTDNGLEFCNRGRVLNSLLIESGCGGLHRTFDRLTGCRTDGVGQNVTIDNNEKSTLRSCAGSVGDIQEDQTDQEYGDDEDARDQETDQPPDFTDYQLVRNREPKTRTKPLRFQDESNMAAYAFVAAEEEDTHEPLTYQEAVACEDSSKWKSAMKEEMDSLRKNKTCDSTTWELVDPLAGQKLVSSKWMYKIKEGIKGVQNPRYKAGLVAHGFTQRAGIDYNEVFSPVVRHTSIRVILALTACKDYELEQLDVKTAFLHGNLEEVIYMRQPPGYEQGNKICLLKKSLYGLKQSPRQWSYSPGEYIYLLLYVDDMLITCKSKAKIGSTKSLLKKEFDMKELGEAKKILSMEIVRDRSHKIMTVLQSGYVFKILNKFRIDNGKSVQMPLGGHFKLSLKDCPVRDCDVERMSKVPYANVVWSLIYLMVCMRPDIAYAVSLVYGIDRGSHVDVTGFVNYVDVKDPDKDVKYMALTEAVKEAIYLRGLMEELGVRLNTMVVNCDNQGAIHLSWNHVFHERTKHINVRYHFIKEVLEAKIVKVLKVGTEHNTTDALTKVVPGQKLQHYLELLSVGIG